MLSDIFSVDNFIKEHHDPDYVYGPTFIHYIAYSCSIDTRSITTYWKTFDSINPKIMLYVTSDKSIIEEISTYYIQPYKVSLLNMILSNIPKYLRLTELQKTLKLNNSFGNLMKVNDKTVIKSTFHLAHPLNFSAMITLLAVHMNNIRNYQFFRDLSNNCFSIIIYLKLQDTLSNIDVIRDTAVFMLSFIESIKIY